MIRPLVFRVTGMHCPACEFLVADEVACHPSVRQAQASRSDGLLKVEWEGEEDASLLQARWNATLDPLGYRLWREDENPSAQLRKETVVGLALGAGFLVMFAGLQGSGLVDLLAPDSLELPGAFVLGILASLSSCFALVGGLLLSYTAAVGKQNPSAVSGGLWAFHLSRLATFFFGGGLLGLAGAALGSSLEVQRLLLTVAALVMTGLGANLLGWKLPSWGNSGKGMLRARRLASWGTLGGGILLGAITFLLPCGFTQSVQFQALAAGGFWEAATLTLVFALGTLPVLASVGWLLGKGLAGKRRAILLKAGATTVLGLGLFQLWGAAHLWGVNFLPL